MAPSDAELLGRIASGDREAFATLYDRYAPRAYGLLLRVLRNRADADDVLQETFLQVWRQAIRFDPSRAAADVWVLLVARSRAVDRLRKRGVATTGELPDPPMERDPAGDLNRREDAGRVRTALDVLPLEQREPIRLSFFDGMTHTQIARRLGLPLGTVKTRIRLGMLRLRDRLSTYPAEGVTP